MLWVSLYRDERRPRPRVEGVMDKVCCGGMGWVGVGTHYVDYDCITAIKNGTNPDTDTKQANQVGYICD